MLTAPFLSKGLTHSTPQRLLKDGGSHSNGNHRPDGLPPPQRVRDVNPKLAYQDDWEEARSGGRKVRKERTAVFGPDPKSSLTV